MLSRLLCFLVTAITTSQLASALRRRAEEANRRERETHILYDLVHATNREEDMEHQLSIFAHSVVEVFSSWEIRNCIVLLLDETGKLVPQIGQYQMHDQKVLSAYEEEVIAQACTIDVYNDVLQFCCISSAGQGKAINYMARKPVSKQYTRLIPLKTEQKVVGVLCLFMEDSPQHLFLPSTRLM